MQGPTRFFRPTVLPDLWDRLDQYEASTESNESAEEAEQYDRRVREDIKWKGNYHPPIPSASATAPAPDPSGAHVQLSANDGPGLDGSTSIDIPPAGQGSIVDSTYLPHTLPQDGVSEILDSRKTAQHRFSILDKSTLPPIPSFRPSHIQTSTPLHIAPPAPTAPSISTPSASSISRITTSAIQMPDAHWTPMAGPSRIPYRSSTLPSTSANPISRPVDTPPPSVASPVDTPGPSGVGIGEGRARRDPPDTPVPLASLTALAGGKSKLKGKKELQTLTKRWEDFNKGLEKEAKEVAAAEKEKEPAEGAGGTKGKGRARTVSKTMAVKELGAGVLKGLRLCLPVMPGQEGHQADRWKIISKMGGEVLLQPDTAVTHVIFDGPGPPAKLARLLDLPSLASLPEGTICVKWNWIGACKTNNKLLDPDPWLSFPRTNSRTLSAVMPLKPVSSRIGDITDRLIGQTISITRKRSASRSDSETASPKKPKPLPSRLSSYVPAVKPAQKQLSAIGPPAELKDRPNATKHTLPIGPGWSSPKGRDRDGLDEVINGVKDGTMEDDEPLDDDGEDGGENDTANPNSRADNYKCGQASDGTSNKGPNEWLAKKFDEMHDLYSGMQGKNEFSIRGYLMAAAALRRTPHAITSGKAARGIKGIGENLANRIDEILEDRPGRLFYEDNEQTRAVATFKDIYGVGRTLANQLWQKGARGVADLKADPEKYGLTSYHHQVGLELYDDLLIRIPRAECKQIYDTISTVAKTLDPKIEIEIMGSYRRGQEDSGDVDFLITRDPSDGRTHAGMLKELVETLFANGVITHELSRPGDWTALEAKWMGVCRVSPEGVHRRIDILCIPYDQWGAALIYFTGNDIFNRSLRLYARHQGYSLNQRGLSKGVIRGKDGLKLTEGKSAQLWLPEPNRRSLTYWVYAGGDYHTLTRKAPKQFDATVRMKVIPEAPKASQASTASNLDFYDVAQLVVLTKNLLLVDLLACMHSFLPPSPSQLPHGPDVAIGTEEIDLHTPLVLLRKRLTVNSYVNLQQIQSLLGCFRRYIRISSRRLLMTYEGAELNNLTHLERAERQKRRPAFATLSLGNNCT